MMEIVIKMPEEYYKAITEIPNHQCTFDMLIIKNGKPLPRGHGRLIDADELEECVELMNTINGESKYAIRCDDIRNMATIIEANKENEE